MKKYDLELTSENIINSIKENYIDRNAKLNKLIEIINSQQQNIVISIDGKWGSGKTFFVKQLLALNNSEDLNKFIGNNDSISLDVIQDFREKYVAYYYNAWENDMHTSPLQSLIYNLINDFPTEKNQPVGNKIPIPFNIKELLKSISANAIDFDKYITYADLAKDIISNEEKKIALNQLINDIFPNNKRILFIIDEVDRCKPTYAIELLEVIKHCFNNDRIVFIISTNNEQLMNVINNFYGSNFDGYGYLNKFYNLIVELNEVNVENYLTRVLNMEKKDNYYNNALYGVIEYFQFSMREINRIILDFDLLKKYFTTSTSGYYSDNNILKYIFLPYCLALRIKNKHLLSNFLDGEGLEEVISFSFKNQKIYEMLKNEVDSKSVNQEVTDEKMKKVLEDEYNCYFGKVKKDNTYKQSIVETQIKDFYEVFSLLGPYTNI